MWGRVKRSFVAGLVLVAPLVITLLVLRTLAGWALVVVDPVVEGTRLARYTGEVTPAAQVLAAAVIAGGIVVLGYVAERPAGGRLFGSVGRLVSVVPVVNTVYTSVRQVATSLTERNTRYESVVLVEYPRDGVYVIGLVTDAAPGSVAAVAGEGAQGVFLPNSPNPTGGRLVFVPEERIHEIDMSVRRGLRLIVTTGLGEGGEPALPGEATADLD